MSCIICQNSNSLISMLCSNLCNLYLNKTFLQGKKEAKCPKLCSKSQEGMHFATPWDCRTKISWPWPEHIHPVHTKGKEQTHAFPCNYFLFYPNESYHFSLLCPTLQKHLLQQCSNSHSAGLQGPIPSHHGVRPWGATSQEKEVYYCCQCWSQFLLDTSSYKLSSYTC